MEQLAIDIHCLNIAPMVCMNGWLDAWMGIFVYPFEYLYGADYVCYIFIV